MKDTAHILNREHCAHSMPFETRKYKGGQNLEFIYFLFVIFHL